MKIYTRYVIKQALKVQLLFLFCFYLAYALIDYSMHMRSFIDVPSLEVSAYYLFLFLKRLEYLIPLSLVIAVIKVMGSLRSHMEVTAFEIGGIGKAKLMRPFFTLSLLLTSLLYLNYEFTFPISIRYVDNFQDTYLRKKIEQTPHSLQLTGDQRLVYGDFRKVDQTLLDVYYFPNQDELFHMKALQGQTLPTGSYVDHLIRKEDGKWSLDQSMITYRFPKLANQLKNSIFTPYVYRSISQLSYEKENEPLNHLLFKLTFPLLSILGVMGIAPFVLPFRRDASAVITYAIGLSGMLLMFVCLSTARLIGSMSPWLAYVPLLTLMFAFFGKKYRRVV